MNRTPRTPPVAALFLALPLALAGCEAPRAHGDVHAVIVASGADLWDAVELELEGAIAPTIQVVRNERAFRVTWQDPSNTADWANLRRFRNLVVVGAAGESWIDEALAALPRNTPAPTPPALLSVENVWARGQSVTVLLLPEPDELDALRGLLPSLSRHLDDQYRSFAINRMYVSGRNSALADSLAAQAGFRLDLPMVYRVAERNGVFRFRNDNPSPAELIREISVSWVSPIPASLPDRGEIEAWREAFAAAHYQDPQVLDTTLTSLTPFPLPDEGGTGVEYQASWASPPGAWPAGGPIITRVVPCPAQDRLYTLDAWLYAPSREKYEYMIQLQTLLDSFRCVGGAP
jgi:hypothetical protein